MNRELHPIDDGDSVLIPTGVELLCPECQAVVMFPFPTGKRPRGHFRLFGDESYHRKEVTNRLSYVYALVGFNADGHRMAVDALSALKQTIRPSVAPEEWPLHVADIRSDRWRKTNQVVCGIDAINSACREFASKIGQLGDHNRLILACMFPEVSAPPGIGKRAFEEIIRDRTITGAILTAVDAATKEGWHLSFFLERIYREANDDFMDSYVEKIGRSLFYNLNFHYAARGHFVALPTTIEKTGGVEVEIADFVAYWTNRYLLLRKTGREPEVSLETMGMICWAAYTPSRLQYRYSVGVPWNYFYPGH